MCDALFKVMSHGSQLLETQSEIRRALVERVEVGVPCWSAAGTAGGGLERRPPAAAMQQLRRPELRNRQGIFPVPACLMFRGACSCLREPGMVGLLKSWRRGRPVSLRFNPGDVHPNSFATEARGCTPQ